MRKIFSFLMSVAVAATTFVGCTNTEINIDSTPTPTPTGTYRQLTFSTEQDASRTHHNGETIIWSKGDKIRIGYTKDGVWQNAEGRTGAQDDTSTAKLYASNELGSDCEYSKFTLTTLFKDTDATGPIIFYGLYPSNITKRNEPDFADSAEGTINVVLPQIQSPAATSFDSNADLMVSQSVKIYEALPTYEEHISMRWTRLVTHGMITLKNLTAAGITADEKVQYVIIEADAEGDALTGEFTLDIDGQTLTPIDGKSKNKVRLSYADTDYNTLTDADEDGAADDFVVWFATAPFEATSLTITVGTDKATYTRYIASANKTFVVNKRNKLGINMASATPVEIETEDNWMMVQDKTKFVDGITVIIAKMFSSGSGPALSTDDDEKGTSGSITVSKDDVNNTYTVTNLGDNIQQFKLGVNPEVSGQYSFQALNGPNAGKYLSTSAPDGDGPITYVQEQGKKFWTVNTSAFQIDGSTQLDAGDVKLANGSSSLTYYSNQNSTTYNQKFCIRESYTDYCKPITLYYNATALPSLSAPVINSAEQTAEGNAVQVAWGEVKNALSYTITATCEGKEDIVVKNITDTTYTVDGFVEGTWTITVTAAADNYKSATSAVVNVEVIDKTPRITVTPTELAFTSAGGTKSITVETSYFGANVEISAVSSNNAFDVSVDVSVDGTTVSVTAGVNETDAAIEGTITVTATDGATTLTADVAVQQAAKSNATAEWQLLTDLRSLQTEGLEVIIASANSDTEGNDFAMSTTQNSNNRGQDAITKSDDKNTLSMVGANVQIFQLQQGTTEGTWAFFDETYNKNEGGYLYAASSSNNYLRTQKENDVNGSWTITVNDKVASIVATNSTNRNVLRYNSGSDLFSCYESESSVQPVAIYYRLASTEPDIKSVSTENDATEFEHDGSTTINATVATKYAAGETLSVTFDGDWVTIDPATVTVEEDNTATFALTAAENIANEPRTITMTVSLNGSSKQLTFKQKAAPIAATGWALLTDVADLKPGMEVVITANTANCVLGALLKDEYFTAVSGITFSDDKSTITALPVDAIIFTIGGTTDAYTFSCDSGLLGSSSATVNRWGGNNTTWTLTPNDGNVDIISVGTNGKLQYNTANPRFKNYTSSQGEVQIYYRGEGSGEFPSLTVTPTSLTWEADATEAQQITVTANDVWSHSKSGMDWATVSVSDSGNIITVTPKAANSNEAANEGTITISMAGVDNVVVNCSQAGATQSGGGEGGSDHVYTKVTSAPADWSGQYLIVYEGGNAAFNGSLATLDAASNYKTVTIANDQISLSAAEDTFYFTIAKTASGYSIQSASGKYIGRTANSNGMNTGTTAYTNTIEYSNNAVTIKGSGSTATYLRFNKNSDQMRFRYFTTTQQLIQLYKLEGDGGNAGGGDTPATPTQLTMSEVSCTEQTENSLTFSWSEVTGATGYQVSTDNSTWSSPNNGNLSHTLSGLTADTQYTLYVKAIGDGVNYTNSDAVSAQGATSAASGGGAKTYSFTILPSNFNSTSYAANNNSKTSTATATDGSTMQVSWTSNQVMLQSGVMQWQKSKGYIYNTTDLGTIKSITVNSSAGTFTQYINSSQKPTSNGTGGYFQIKVGSATGYVSSIEVTFEK